MNESRPSSLEELAVRCRACTACGLASTRTHVVFGVGVPDAEVLLVGEGPGETKTSRGNPLSGGVASFWIKCWPLSACPGRITCISPTS